VKSFAVVDQFEARVAEFAGSRFAVATNTCTSALFLCMKYASRNCPGAEVILPARTFVSVPMAAIQAGLRIKFSDYAWSGTYNLSPFAITDGALRFKKGMYQGGLHCLSFHARKLLNIGEGGMVLTDDKDAAQWLRKARYSGRGGPTYRVEDIDMIGWQMYMTPEKAARGLHLMDYVEDWPDQVVGYPDLRQVKAFHDQ
jgi:dTDP-4-amino-4,6-dideoxygalactose transaminase